MHIVMLSDHETRGGAAIAASRLANGLAAAGQRVTRIVMAADGQAHSWQTEPLPATGLDRLKKGLLPESLSSPWLEQGVGIRLERTLKQLQPDLINLHGLHGGASLGWTPTIAEICAQFAPIIWTLHDMWSFTGRCAYSGTCRKFIEGCDAACPTPNEYPALMPQRIAGAWHKRQALFANSPNLVAVSPSQWLAHEAQLGLWGGHRVEVIPNGLPLELYRPTERAQARKLLGLETTGPVLLISARRFNRHKGAALFFEALQQLAIRPLSILVMGEADFVVQDERIQLIQLGFVDDESKKALVYSAADLFVHPAVNDNLPNVIMEALACGTPVAAFPVGGIPEMVRPNVTGWLAETVSAGGLAHLLATILADRQTPGAVNSQCRWVAETEFGDSLQAQRYLALGASMLEPQATQPLVY